MKILLAEADGAPAGRLFHLLVKNGYQTTAVKTGQAALDCLIKPVDDNELLRITALQRRTQTGGERCRNLSFLSSTTLGPKRASAAVHSGCRACHACAGHGTIKTDEAGTLDFSGVPAFLVTNAFIVQRSAAKMFNIVSGPRLLSIHQGFCDYRPGFQCPWTHGP